MKDKNILLIVTDQWRSDCIGFNNSLVKTPNIDLLANNGIVYNNAYCSLPSCCPSRQAMLTGITPEKLGALWNYDCGLPVYSITPQNDITYSALMKENGYTLGYIGKWHGSEKYLPTDFGFDYYVSDRDYITYRNANYPDCKLKPIDWLNNFGGEVDSIPLKASHTHFLAENACRLIESFKDKKWHIRLDYNEPHLPCFPCKEFYEMYKDVKIPQWKSFEDTFINKPYMQTRQLKNWNAQDMEWEDWEKILRLEFAYMSQTDDSIGIVINALRETGQLDDTIIIFTSDHGDMCGSHRMVDKNYVLYDDIIRIPLIVYGLGKGIDNRIVENIDFAPTMLNLIGAPVPDCMQGQDFTTSNKEWAVSTFNGQQFGLYTLRSITGNGYKYIFNATDICEFYDLNNDPHELNNQIHNEKFKDIILSMRKNLYYILLERGDKLVSNPWMKNRFLSDHVD